MKVRGVTVTRVMAHLSYSVHWQRGTNTEVQTKGHAVL